MAICDVPKPEQNLPKICPKSEQNLTKPAANRGTKKSVGPQVTILHSLDGEKGFTSYETCFVLNDDLFSSQFRFIFFIFYFFFLFSGKSGKKSFFFNFIFCN